MSPEDHAHGKRAARDALIVTALGSGLSYTEAAEAAGVSRVTVARRMRDVEFRAEVAAERDRVTDELRGRLLAAGPTAITTLGELAEGARTEAVRLGAARALLELALRHRPGADAPTRAEFRGALREVMGLALGRMEDGAATGFLEDVAMLSRH